MYQGSDEAQVVVYGRSGLSATQGASVAEREIHHRAEIYAHLAILGVPTPPLYGLTSEH